MATVMQEERADFAEIMDGITDGSNRVGEGTSHQRSSGIVGVFHVGCSRETSTNCNNIAVVHYIPLVLLFYPKSLEYFIPTLPKEDTIYPYRRENISSPSDSGGNMILV